MSRMNLPSQASERVQRFLARNGVGSRRQIENWIRTGRLLIDGVSAQLGQCVQGQEAFCLDGVVLLTPAAGESKTAVLLYHKPEGELCSTVSESGQRTVFESLPDCPSGRWIQIGRLDLNTSGLLLFTNDGDLAHGLMHPRNGVERGYLVRVHGRVSSPMLSALRRGVELEDGPARFSRITPGRGDGTNRWFEVVLAEGRHRIVRRLWASQGCEVTRLKRIHFGTLALPRDFPPRTWRHLTFAEVLRLQRVAGRAVGRREDGARDTS